MIDQSKIGNRKSKIGKDSGERAGASRPGSSVRSEQLGDKEQYRIFDLGQRILG